MIDQHFTFKDGHHYNFNELKSKGHIVGIINTMIHVNAAYLLFLLPLIAEYDESCHRMACRKKFYLWTPNFDIWLLKLEKGWCISTSCKS